MEENGKIPFNKAARVGNYKVWRSRHKVGDTTIEVLNVSTLDGAWMTRIPSTLEMFGWLCMAYSDYKSEDIQQKAQGEAVMTTVFSNMLYVSSIGNGYYQRALELCATVYAHPSLLDKKSKEHNGFVKDVKAIIDMFLEWRKGYEEKVRTLEPTEKESRQDEIAEEALDIVANSDN